MLKKKRDSALRRRKGIVMTSDSDDDEFSEFRVQSDLFPSRTQSLAGSPAKPKQVAAMAAKPQLSNRQEIQGLQAQWQKANNLANGSLENSLFASSSSSSPQTGTKRQRPHEGGGQEGLRSSAKRRQAADDNWGGSSDRLDVSALYSSAGVPFPSSAPPSVSRPSTGSGAGQKSFVLRESATSSATSTPTAGRTVVAPTAPVIRNPRTAGSTPTKMNSTPIARPKPFNSGLDLAAPIISCSSGSEDEIPSVPAAMREKATTQSRGTPGATDAQRSAKSTNGKPAAPSYVVPANITPVPIPRPFGAVPPRTQAVASPTTNTPETKPTNFLATKSKKLYSLWVDEQGRALSASGTLIPDHYKKHPDPKNPWACPIVDCPRRFVDLRALGGHFSAGHRGLQLNDNCDGTLSVIGKVGQTAPIIISQISRNLNGTPVGVRTPAATTKAPSSAPRSRRNTPTTTRTNSTSSRAPSTEQRIIQGSASAPSAPEKTLSSIPDYLKEVLPNDYDVRIFTDHKEWNELRVLRRRRSWPPEIAKYCSELTMGTRKPTLGLILYLTGTEAERSCEPCARKHPSLCIVTDDSFPESLIDFFGDCCAMCHYRAKRWRWRHQYTLGDGQDGSSNIPTPYNGWTGSGTASRRSPAVQGNGVHENQSEDGDSTESEDTLPDAVGPESEATSERNGPVGETQQPIRRMVTLRSGRIAELGAAPQRPSNSTPQTNTTPSSAPIEASHGGNGMPVVSVDSIAMEDWEIAPGRISTAGPDGENVVFSNAYLTRNKTVPIADGIGFNVIFIKPGSPHNWQPEADSIRICVVSAGKLVVKMGVGEGAIDVNVGPHGMFKILPGMVCVVKNRLYIDAVVHVTTIDMG